MEYVGITYRLVGQPRRVTNLSAPADEVTVESEQTVAKGQYGITTYGGESSQ